MSRVGSARLALGLAALLWGTGWPFSKALLGVISPAAFLVLVVAAAAVVAVAVAALRRSPLPRGRTLLAYAGLGVISPGWNYALGVGGLHETTAGAAALISSLEPVAVVLLSVALLGARLDRRTAAAVAVATLGLALLADPATAELRSLLGTAEVAAGVALAALFVVLAQRVAPADPFAATAIELVAGTATLLALAFAQHGSAAFANLPSAPVLALVVASGPLLDYLPFLLLAFASAFVPASTTGMLFALMPVSGVLLSTWLLHERLGPWQAAGALIVVGSVAWFQASHAVHGERISIGVADEGGATDEAVAHGRDCGSRRIQMPHLSSLT